MRLAPRLALPALIAVITLFACGSSAGSGGTPAPAASAGAGGKSAAVAIKGFAFSPATLSVDKGTTVTFTNNDSATHTVTSGANRTKDGKFDQQLSGGAEATVTFDTPGTVDYFCTIHSSMIAKVVVK
jgi:plastocyanin